MAGTFRATASIVASLIIPLFVTFGTASAGPLEDFRDAVMAKERGDHATALRLFQKLADQGMPGGYFGIGLMHFEGSGVPRNYDEALKWYRLAAEKEHYHAQFEIGAMYDTGTGVRRDHAEAARWYRRAAGHGYAKAQSNLAAMFLQGVGVARDYAEAYKWFSLSVSHAQPAQLREFTENRDRVARQMTAAQVGEAQRRAREWKTRQ